MSQKQVLGNNSAAIQVNGNLNVISTSYQEIKTIFRDLFDLNFPKLQEAAAKIASERVEEMLGRLKMSLEAHKEDIDPTKFADPGVQFEMANMVIDVARKGVKSNMEMLCELLCIITSKDCPELIELVAGEARRVLPLLNKKHLSYLSLLCLVSSVPFENQSVETIDNNLAEILNHVNTVNEITQYDRDYLISIGCIRHRGTGIGNLRPFFVAKNEHLSRVSIGDQYLKYCEAHSLLNIAKLSHLIESGSVGFYCSTATGGLIGRLNLREYIPGCLTEGQTEESFNISLGF